jgi:molecular chaperone DnaJ
MPDKRDYYEVLGIPREATPEQLKRAFRKLAFQYHPDHNDGKEAEARFKEINEAYEILSNQQKRAEYDRYGHARSSANSSPGFEGFDVSGMGDIFDAFFGGFASSARDRRAPRRGADIEVKLTLSFEEAVFGSDKEIELTRVENCSVCHGSGNTPGAEPVVCAECHGRGETLRTLSSVFGRFTQIHTCPRCNGTGKSNGSPCTQCKGNGREKQKRKLKVKVPAGIDQEHPLRLEGEGEAGIYGGYAGDIVVSCNIRPHQYFARDNHDILYELPLNFAQAALGDSIEVPTMYGKTTLKIPAGTQNGEVFQLKGKGVPHLNGRGKGDQMVTVKIHTPRKLNEKQRQIFQELSKTLPQQDQPS